LGVSEFFKEMIQGVFSLRTLLLCLVFCVALWGCKLDVPAIGSASYVTYEKGSISSPRTLSNAQIGELTAWFASHRSGWSQTFATYVPGILIDVKHANGRVSYVNVWPHQIVAESRHGQYVRALSEPEYTAFLRVLSLPKPIHLLGAH
jgi:hypothetical protein